MPACNRISFRFWDEPSRFRLKLEIIVGYFKKMSDWKDFWEPRLLQSAACERSPGELRRSRLHTSASREQAPAAGFTGVLV